MSADQRESVRARAGRILRAKAGELEGVVLEEVNAAGGHVDDVNALRADVALIAGIVADLLELEGDG